MVGKIEGVVYSMNLRHSDHAYVRPVLLFQPRDASTRAYIYIPKIAQRILIVLVWILQYIKGCAENRGLFDRKFKIVLIGQFWRS